MATWAKGVDFKNSANTARVGGVGIYGTDGTVEKAYLGVGTEPWNKAGLEVTSSTISFKGNKVYHAGDKPTPSEIGAAASSHGTHVTYSTTAPLANGTASAGSASTVARTDHVHPLQTTVSGNAGTATKLQNIRKINGTNFDGSGDITTANWGTARNITIGSTKKSVNGSADVVWSLSEIGAAPASHSHSNYASTSHTHSSLTGTAGSTIAPSTGTGVMRYDYNVSSANAGTLPNSNNANGILTLNTHSGNYYNQLGFSSNGNLYYRAFNGTALDTTTAWKQIAFTNSSITGNAGTATKLQTARTINGTNFDGTGNITTANWGTSRAITIGSTSKSVNGSGNVTWSLSEIGAAAESHTHSGYAASSHNHTSLTGVTNIAFAAGSSDSASMGIAVSDDKTYFDFNLSDDVNADMWRWRFGAWDSSTSSAKTFNAMTLTATSTTAAKLTVSGTVQASAFSGALSGNATTATTLATARTINGTSFNGSANITTANWGTARNIQIGNTAKSVNGSANVTWTLGEIGAAASNHTHGLVNLNSEAFSGGNDLNTYNSTKTWVARTLDSTTNKPADYFTVVNFGANSNSNFQLAHSYSNNSILYVRGRHDTSGNYTPWAKIYTDKNKPTASEIGAAAASHTHNYAGSSSAGGAANTAVKLATARTIALGGILSGSASFDGSGNVTINAAANDITTISKSLKVTTSWMDTGITGTNLATGTYAIQMLVNDGTNTSQWNEHYSGIMSWYADGTNSTDADEILLHKAGHASNSRHTYLRTLRQTSGVLKLQISTTHNFSEASNIVFKFKKLI